MYWYCLIHVSVQRAYLVQTPCLGCLAPTKAIKSQALTLTFISGHRSQHLYTREITSKRSFAFSFACFWLSRSSSVSWPYQVSLPSTVSKSTLVFFSNTINYPLSWGPTQDWRVWFPVQRVFYSVVLNCVERQNTVGCSLTMWPWDLEHIFLWIKYRKTSWVLENCKLEKQVGAWG